MIFLITLSAITLCLFLALIIIYLLRRNVYLNLKNKYIIQKDKKRGQDE